MQHVEKTEVCGSLGWSKLGSLVRLIDKHATSVRRFFFLLWMKWGANIDVGWEIYTSMGPMPVPLWLTWKKVDGGGWRQQ